MRRFAVLVLICSLVVVAGAQKTSPAKTGKKSQPKPSQPYDELYVSLLISKKAPRVRAVAEVTLGQNQIVSTFEYLAPDRFRLYETNNGREDKEAVEIARQRYQKKDAQWIKTRLDYLPLRDQFGNVFQLVFSSSRTDVIRVRNVTVDFVGVETKGKIEYRKLSFSTSYNEPGLDNSGIAWINAKSGLIERIEITGGGLFGRASSVWNYYYDSAIKIEPPTDFIEKDWVD